MHVKGKFFATLRCAFFFHAGLSGEYGAIVNWFHMACARYDDAAVAYAKMGETKMSKTILGFADMPVDLQRGRSNLTPA